MWKQTQEKIQEGDKQHTLNPDRLKPETYITNSTLTEDAEGTTTEAANQWYNIIQDIENTRCLHHLQNDTKSPSQKQEETQEADMEEKSMDNPRKDMELT